MYLGGQRADARPSTDSSTSPRCGASCPTTSRIACCSPSTARTSDGSPTRLRRSSRARLVIDVDHHHDNTRFGDVNLVVPDASSTAEIVRDILRELDVELTPQIAEALYVGLVTDTGRFQYTNTTPKSLRLAAELVEAGADVHGDLPARLRDGAVREAEAARAGARPRAASTRAAGSSSRTSCATTSPRSARRGAVLRGDHRLPPRSRGRRDGRADPRAAARRRRPTRRISLRSSHDELDVSAIARQARRGRPPQAAGFSSEESVDEIIEFIRREFASLHGRAVPPRARRPVGIALVDKPAGPSSFAIVAACAAGPVRGPGTRGRSTRSRPGSAGPVVGAATRLAPCFVGLDKRYVTDDRPDRDDVDRRSGRRGRSTARAAGPLDELDSAARAAAR